MADLNKKYDDVLAEVQEAITGPMPYLSKTMSLPDRMKYTFKINRKLVNIPGLITQNVSHRNRAVVVQIRTLLDDWREQAPDHPMHNAPTRRSSPARRIGGMSPEEETLRSMGMFSPYEQEKRLQEQIAQDEKLRKPKKSSLDDMFAKANQAPRLFGGITPEQEEARLRHDAKAEAQYLESRKKQLMEDHRKGYNLNITAGGMSPEEFKIMQEQTQQAKQKEVDKRINEKIKYGTRINPTAGGSKSRRTNMDEGSDDEMMRIMSSMEVEEPVMERANAPVPRRNRNMSNNPFAEPALVAPPRRKGVKRSYARMLTGRSKRCSKCGMLIYN